MFACFLIGGYVDYCLCTDSVLFVLTKSALYCLAACMQVCVCGLLECQSVIMFMYRTLCLQVLVVRIIECLRGCTAMRAEPVFGELCHTVNLYSVVVADQFYIYIYCTSALLSDDLK